MTLEGTVCVLIRAGKRCSVLVMYFSQRFFLQAVFFFTLPFVSVTGIHVDGRSSTVTVGEDAILFCQLIGTTETLTRITWQRRTHKSFTNENIFVISSDGKAESVNGLGDRIEFVGNTKEYNGTVRMKNITSLDHQIYTCIFNIFPSGPFEKEINLNVYVPPDVSVFPDVTPVVGDSEVILVSCSARSRPASEVTWNLGDLNSSLKIKTDVSAGPNDYYTVSSRLIGVPSKELNEQNVQCVVNHTSLKKEIVRNYALVIHYPPQIVYITSGNPSTKHQEFLCVADANPKPTLYIWSRENKALTGRVDFDRLEIPLSSDSSGLYKCNASNQYGNGVGTMYIPMSPDISPDCTTCWTLFIIFIFLSAAAFLIWKCISSETCTKRISDLRERILPTLHVRVPTDSPPRNRELNHTDSGERRSE
ncbi:nectin-1 isoform X2 [Astyanax mexicanus]|uniref:nectin-1 isoform X2 n=1 Tax=Astyanax mexicanus TaxID=7994 RepID=UPI0020CB2433|nr:nectin-1 isoform X2 [Astyanax mexicanus]